MTGPSATSSAAQRAVSFAERQGLNSVYEEAKNLEDDLRVINKESTRLADVKREILEKISVVEADLTLNERAKESAMSATAFEQHIKLVIRKDRNLQSLRLELRTAQSQHDYMEANSKEVIEQIRLRTARLNELGGYFNYLAAIRSTTPTTP